MTKEEMLAELQGLMASAPDPDGYYSPDEFADMMGVSKATALKRLKVAQRAGRLAVVKVKDQSTDGRMMMSFRYRILPV